MPWKLILTELLPGFILGASFIFLYMIAFIRVLAMARQIEKPIMICLYTCGMVLLVFLAFVLATRGLLMISEKGEAFLGILPGMVFAGLFISWERVAKIYNFLVSRKKKG